MTDLRTGLGEAVGAAFAEAGLAASFGRVTPSDRPDLADFQCNGALAAAKSAGRKPRDIAEDVAARLAALAAASAPLHWKSARSGRSEPVTRPYSPARSSLAKAAARASPRPDRRSVMVGRRRSSASDRRSAGTSYPGD